MSKKLELKLSEYELNQSGVLKIISYLEDRLVLHRVTNDNVNADPLLRGNIAEIKLLCKKLRSTDKSIVGINHPNLRIL